MALSFLLQTQKISDAQLIARTAAAMVKAALAVVAEVGSTPGHAERVAYAVRVLGDPSYCAARVVYGVVGMADAGTGGPTDPLASGSSNDTALYNAVASFWNAYAGYSPAVPVV